MTEDYPDPVGEDLFREIGYPLKESISSLVTIAELNPSLLDQVMRFAIVLGIHAQRCYAERIEEYDRLKGMGGPGRVQFPVEGFSLNGRLEDVIRTGDDVKLIFRDSRAPANNAVESASKGEQPAEPGTSARGTD